MNKQEASLLLQTYVPGQGMESVPGMREALAMAEQDPELKATMEANLAFDASMTSALRGIPVPSDLQASLLELVSAPSPSRTVEESPSIMGWFHFLSLGAAAVVTLSLALFFTYVYEHPTVATANAAPMEAAVMDPIIDTADALFAALRPRMRDQSADAMRQFVISNGGHLPRAMPPGFSWDASRACDVVAVGDARVSIICFEAPDKSGMLHLFIFRRSDFPEARHSHQPILRERPGSCCATWADDEGIHVLYSEKGRENLHQALEI